MAYTRQRRGRCPVVLALVVMLTLLIGGGAFAQDLPTLEEAPPAGAPKKPGGAAPAVEVPEAIDVSDMVLAAAKAPISIQESPSIISVITREQILSRGFRTLWDVLATVPGFESYRYQYVNRYADAMVLGNANVVLVLWNGIAVTDANDGTAAMDRRFPLDNIERIEVTTGPGGVLWGANAFLGVVNVVTRDAQSWRGLEFYAGGGTGNGEQNTFKTSLSLGERFFNGKLRFYLNANFYSSNGPSASPTYDLLVPVKQPPNPDGAWTFRPAISGISLPRQYMAVVTGSVGAGPVSFDYYIPYERIYSQFNDLLERGDAPYQWNKSNLSLAPCGSTLAPDCSAHQVFARTTNTFRVLALRYQDLLLNQKLSLNGRAYFTSFNDVSMSQAGVPVGIFKEPLLLNDYYGSNPRNAAPWMSNYRYGGNIDAAITLPYHNRLVVGGEVFNEGVDTRRIGQYSGDTSFALNQALTPPGGFQLIAYPAHRIVTAAFAHDEWRPWSRLALSAGVRVQYEASDINYNQPIWVDQYNKAVPDPTTGVVGAVLPGGKNDITASQKVVLGQAAGVYQIWKKTHIKVNFAQGFRPPHFTDLAAPVSTTGNAFPGNPNLGVERSQAIEGEINTILLERTHGIRKLFLRGDYSYTTLSGLIVRPTFVAENSGNRTANSVQAAGYLEGMAGWNFWLNYYFLDLVDSQTGPVRNVARQHLNLGGSIKLLRNKLELNTVVTIQGPVDDLNRAFIMDPAHQTASSQGFGAYSSSAGQLRLDHLPPVALWRVGFWIREILPRVDLSAYVDNLLNVRWAAADVEYNARQAPFPIPMPGISFFVSAWIKL